jgi:hydroxymethylpyrimidine/phosphomethylpyrimidine kinase
MTKNILCIGQSDSSAGTGIQGDLKTAQALGVYAGTVITTVTAQNTQGVFETHILPDNLVHAQMEAVMNDLDPSVIKIGSLGTTAIIDMVGDFLDNKKTGLKVVIDPVMTNRAGNSLLDKPARDALKRRLLIHADVFTPNVSEISALTGIDIRDIDQMRHAGEMLHTLGAKVVIVKGAELPGEKFFDLYISEEKEADLECARSPARHTHGSGTTLATAIACGLAKGMNPYDSFLKAHEFMTAAIESGPKIGSGKNGPLNHTLHNLDKYRLK